MNDKTVNKLAELLKKFPSSIEFLPGDGSDWLDIRSDKSDEPFILVEGHLGIPEKALFQCYIQCTKAFHAIHHDSAVLSAGRTHNPEELDKLTSIIILANPGHTTALNSRKCLLESGSIKSRDELQFTAALLTIKQSARVSMLWHHRRWIYSSLHSGGSIDEEFSDVPLAVSDIRAEFELAMNACETYPRNYHAWYHRFLCLQSCVSQARRSVVYSALVREELEWVWGWLRLHISDHSAVNYLTRLYEQLESLNMEDGNVILRADEKERTLELLRLYPSHESLWLHLRCVILVGFRSRDIRADVDPDPLITQIVNDILQQCLKRTWNDIDTDKTIRLVLRHRLWEKTQCRKSEKFDPVLLNLIVTRPLDTVIQTFDLKIAE